MAKQRYGDQEKIKKGSGAYKRARKRARKQGTWQDVRQGGVTGDEARDLRPSKPQGVGGGVEKRARERASYLREHGGLPGGVSPKGGYNRREARKIRGAWQTERAHDPLTPRSGRDIVKQADAMTQLEFGDYENELGRERQYEQGRQNVLYTGDNSWMQQYHAQVAAAAQRQQAAEMAFQAGVDAQMQSAMLTQPAPMAGQQIPGAQAGAGVSPDVAAQAQQAAQARMSMAQQAAVGLATRGAGNVQAVNQLAIAASQQAQEGLRESQARMAKVGQLAQELAIKKGAYRTDAIRKGQETERTYDLSKSAFGLDVAEAQEDARHNRQNERHNRAALRAQTRENNRKYRQWSAEFGADRADEMFDRMESDRQYQLDVDKFGETKAQNRWDRRHGDGRSGGKGGKYTQSQRNDAQETQREVSNAVANFKGNKKYRAMSLKQKIEFLRQRENADPLIVRAVVSPGSLSGAQRRELKRMGIKVPGRQPGNAPSQYESRGGDPSRRT